MDFGSVYSVLEKVRPDVIFHLAAFANVRSSFVTPNLFLSNNILSTSNLFEAIRLTHQDPIIQLCSTSEVYGQVDKKDVPIKENAPMKPASPYAVSKATQDLLGWTYFTSYKMKIIRTRMFTYLNPRRTDLFASSFAKQVAWIERGLQNELTHGNLESVRTIVDMRDAMRAYWLTVLYCNPGEAYNIGGTTTMKVGEFLERLIALSKTSISTRCDPNLLRPSDVTLQIPCIDKFINETGWAPEYSFEESISHLLDFWRKKADNEVKQLS
jgi:GDP-D-mannose dehydratase